MIMSLTSPTSTKHLQNSQDSLLATKSTQKTTTTTIGSTSTATRSLSGTRERVQIFLGGSCNPTTWRQTIAIPFLELNGISYYNPQIADWTPDVVNIERRAKRNADWLFFVIDKQTRSTVSLVESAFMAGAGKRIILVINPFDYSINHLSIQSDIEQTSKVFETHEETTTTSTSKHSASSLQVQSKLSSISSTISKSMKTSASNLATGTIRVNGELISLHEFQELRQARYILQSLVSTREIPIFYDIPQALRYVSKNLTKSSDNSDNSLLRTSEQSEIVDEGNQASGLPPPPSSLSRVPIMDGSVSQSPYKDVYLSLDDNGDSDLESTVIPILQEKGLTYNYKPVSDMTKLDACSSAPVASSDVTVDGLSQQIYSSEENDRKIINNSRSLLKSEFNTIQKSRVILFIITNKCRGLSIMVLASHFMALFRRNVVLCIQYLEEPCCIDGELLSKSAIADYNRGRVYLGDYANESQVPVFANIREAVDCCSQRCGHST